MVPDNLEERAAELGYSLQYRRNNFPDSPEKKFSIKFMAYNKIKLVTIHDDDKGECIRKAREWIYEQELQRQERDSTACNQYV